ncbi:hypothetical protein D9758_005312 [Tetrapyrgos nigripes]|uniref:Uncharacterized protein n=1 Tax=Tetrapyrgos nigripes TaxID=182062 RepID=A0A8H5C0C8_9AGAR|nr:hypothetical protein D9758_017451 [Tetrapyrgos nigripes]KAF5372459.1 hypothetical protein D9758_005312 [Tetrapyrgos nigripes]
MTTTIKSAPAAPREKWNVKSINDSLEETLASLHKYKRLIPYEPTPLPPTEYQEQRLLYGYELTDELFKNFEEYENIKTANAIPGEAPFHRRNRLLAFDAAADAVGFTPSTASLDIGDRSSHPLASQVDICYLAEWNPRRRGTCKLCVSEEKLRELERVLKTDIKAKWIVV